MKKLICIKKKLFYKKKDFWEKKKKVFFINNFFVRLVLFFSTDFRWFCGHYWHYYHISRKMGRFKLPFDTVKVIFSQRSRTDQQTNN